jgi:Protein of unknown function (DUF962).
MAPKRWVPAPGGPRWWRAWLERHQHPASFYLHAVGIPMTLAALRCPFQRRWRRTAGLLAGGYALQFLGHATEGAPPGEVLALKAMVTRLSPRG